MAFIHKIVDGGRIKDEDLSVLYPLVCSIRL